MLIAISTEDNSTEAVVSPHFGRCGWYCLLDTNSKEYLFIENTFKHKHTDAGCDAVNLLLAEGVSSIIAGRFGSQVMDLLTRNNIQMIIPQSTKTVNNLINQLK